MKHTKQSAGQKSGFATLARHGPDGSLLAVRITTKLKAAIQILSDEGMADSSDEAFVIALRKGKLKPQELYKVLASMRYTWNAKYQHWTWRPRHLKSVKRMFAIVRSIDDANFLAEAL